MLLTAQGAPPRLVMGKQQLEGEEVKLKKPIAVMTLEKDEDSRSYRAVGIVRSKLMFKSRPVPVAPVARSEPVSMPGPNKRLRADGPSVEPPVEPPVEA